MRRGIRISALTIVLTVGVAAPGPAPAQERAEGPVPREFVEALIGPFYPPGMGTPELRVGRLPEDFPLRLPAGSRVVGSVVFPGFSQTAIAVPDEPSEARTRWTELVRAAGWEPYRRPPTGGFESAPADNLLFCRADEPAVSLELAPYREGSLVQVRRLSGAAGSICRPETAERGPMWSRESPIPSLRPPEGSVSRGTSSAGSGDEWHAGARVRTPLSALQLLDHYAAQLREEGWEPLERAAASRLATESYRVVDNEGRAWQAVLLVSKPNDEVAFPEVRMTDPEGRP